jgi:hypothetical protein
MNAGSINAYRCYWNENPPNSAQICNALYNPYLTSDPARREVDWTTRLPEDFALAQIYPNPFNPATN